MLISTSRKPSQKTRKFCKNLVHGTGSNYINRGKMNFREVLLKSYEVEEKYIAIVNEIKGNPSRITFYSNNGEIYLIVLISVSLSNERLHIIPKDLKIISKVKKLDILSKILDLELVDNADNNYILISKDENEFIAKINFINKNSKETDLQINIKKILDK